MYNYNSGSDESLENMKLDLIKAKYTHQKLKNNTFNTHINSKSKTLDIKQPKSNKNLDVSQNSIKLKKSNFLKYSKSPTRSNSFMKSIENQSTSPANVDKSEEIFDDYCEVDEEDLDISRMNEYVDYLLNKKRIDVNPSSIGEFQENTLSTKEHQPSMVYCETVVYPKMPDQQNPMPNHSGDILAQWRLRKKLTEAQISVQIDHQRQDAHISMLKSQKPSQPSQSFAAYRHIHLQDNHKPAVDDQMEKPTEKPIIEQVPVRDVVDNNRHSATAVGSATVIKQPVTKSHVSCQCQLDVDDKFHKSNSTQTNHHDKSLRHHKKSSSAKRNLRKSIPLTRDTETNQRKCIDNSVQTEKDQADSLDTIGNYQYTHWEERSASVDYIDLAIQKTLQTQLFERNDSPAVSAVTTIEDSENMDVNVREQSMSICTNNDDKDMAAQDLPWDENYHIESEDEFNQDDVLIDLRRRRNANLQKLRRLSQEIQNCKIRYLASIESC